MFKRLFRKQRHQRLVMWLLVAVFALPLVFFFHVNFRDTGTREGVAGTLYDRPVSQEEFQRHYHVLQLIFQQQFGAIDPAALEPLLIAQTWDRLLLREEARRRRIQVTNEALAATIRSAPTFQRNGVFVPELYHGMLRAQGMTEVVFENWLRDDLRVQTLLSSVDAKRQVSDEEVRRAYEAAHARLRIAAIVIPAHEFAAQAAAAASEEVLRQYYQTHLEAFRPPQPRRIAYVRWTADDARKTVSDPTEEELTTYYDEHSDDWRDETNQPKPLEAVQSELRQRLMEERVRNALDTLAYDLEDDLGAERSLEEIATRHDLAIQQLGPLTSIEDPSPQLPIEILAEAWHAPSGQLTRVQRTSQGDIYLLAATDEPRPELPAFEDVAARVRKIVMEQDARQRARAEAERVRQAWTSAHREGTSWEDPGKTLGHPLMMPKPFAPDDQAEGLELSDESRHALAELPAGDLSPVLDTTDGYAIAATLERLPIDEAAFAAARESFRQQLTDERRAAHRAAWLAELRARAHLTSYIETPKGDASIFPPVGDQEK